MRVLILGGTLFIGRRIALELPARGDDVMVAHRGQTEPAETIPVSVRWHLENPPPEVDEDFSADDRALAAAEAKADAEP